MKLKIHITKNDGSADEQTVEQGVIRFVFDGFYFLGQKRVEIWSDIKELVIKPVEPTETKTEEL